MTTANAMSLSLFVRGTEDDVERCLVELSVSSAHHDFPLSPLHHVLTRDEEDSSQGPWIELGCTVGRDGLNDDRWTSLWRTAGPMVDALAYRNPNLEFMLTTGSGGPGSFVTVTLGSDGAYQGWTTVDGVNAHPTLVCVDEGGRVEAIATDGGWADPAKSGQTLSEVVADLLSPTSAIPEVCVRYRGGASKTQRAALTEAGWEVYSIAESARRGRRAQWSLFSVRRPDEKE